MKARDSSSNKECQASKKRAFFDAIDSLPTGERVRLRRSAGKMLSSADVAAIGAFYRCRPDAPDALLDRWFAAACLHCLWNAGEKKQEPLPEIVGRMQRGGRMSDSLLKRIVGLLDAAWRSDGYLLAKLTRIVRMVEQKGFQVDCEALLTDLEEWNWSDQRVQRSWSQAIFAAPEKDPDPEPMEEN